MDVLRSLQEELNKEAEAILRVARQLDPEQVNKAFQLLLDCQGKVVVTGMGKAGIIARKISATLASTGTTSIFLHAAEGIHGDLGIVSREDVLLAISNSGETRELAPIISSVKHIGAPIIAFTGVTGSSLAKNSDIVIDVSVEKEACPFGLAPTSSSTAALAMGDALAIALIDKRKFREKDFYKFHPGGSLGARLRATVRDAMVVGERIPHVFTGTSAQKAIEEINRMNVGFVMVIDKKKHLLGILTDGDVRRHIGKGLSFEGQTVDEVMTANPKTIHEGASLAETVEFMQKIEITSLAVVSEKKVLKGYVHLHDIFGRGGSVNISLNY